MKQSASYIFSILVVLILINTTLYAQPEYYNQQRTRTAYLAEWKAVENQNTRNNARTPSNTNTTPLTTWRSNQTAEKPVKLTPDQIAKQKKNR